MHKAEMQKIGGTVALIDAEHAFDPEYWRGRPGRGRGGGVPRDGRDGARGGGHPGSIERGGPDRGTGRRARAEVEIEGEIGMVQWAHARLMSQALQADQRQRRQSRGDDISSTSSAAR